MCDYRNTKVYSLPGLSSGTPRLVEIKQEHVKVIKASWAISEEYAQHVSGVGVAARFQVAIRNPTYTIPGSRRSDQTIVPRPLHSSFIESRFGQRPWQDL
jgi:hypothetical protein